MRERGWRARVTRVYRRTAGTHRWFGQHPNRIRQRQTTGPDQIWVGDLTYVSVAGRWWYLAAVLDQHSRRLLAWRLGLTRDALFTRGMLDAALRRRQPGPGLIFHSDRGSEFLGGAVPGPFGGARGPAEYDAGRGARRERPYGIGSSTR